MSSNNITAQQRFDDKYITSREIGIELCLSRTALLNARHRNLLPDPVFIEGANIYLWERDSVREILETWKAKLASRRLG